MKPSQAQRPEPRLRLMSLLLATASACAALFLAAHHPLSVPGAVLLCLLTAGLAARYWIRTPLLLALLPLLGLAPWSGWITFEEVDLLVLSVAAGAYGVLGLGLVSRQRVPVWRRVLDFSPLARLLLAMLGLAWLLAIARGFADAGSVRWAWFEGYHEGMNAVRLAKSMLLALLLLPLSVRAAACEPASWMRALVLGLLLALAGASAAALWERVAFTGLLNFSTDYRTTALFWEMHVGGAALDGCLALTLPFAVWALLRARSARQFLPLLLLLLLAFYAFLTTFSRGLYAALPVSLLLMFGLQGLQQLRQGRGRAAAALPRKLAPALGRLSGWLPALGGLLIVAGFAFAAVQMFPSSGYRGLLALLGAVAVLLLLPSSVWLLPLAQRLTAMGCGAVLALPLALLSSLLAEQLDKFAYVNFVLVWLAALALRWRDRPGQPRPLHLALGALLWFWLLGSVVVVASNWGGPVARDDAAGALVPLGVLWLMMLVWPVLWPFRHTAQGLMSAQSWRGPALLFGSLLLLAPVVASLGGGAYIRERAGTSAQDLDGRFVHWRQSLDLLETPQDWLLGKGAGRFVPNFFFGRPVAERVGDYRLVNDGARNYLALTGGRHVQGWGEVFRISQRMNAPQGLVQAQLRVRAARDVGLHLEICEKHLLYNAACLVRQLNVQARPGVWQDVSLPMGAAPVMGGPWFAPRMVVFSVAVDSAGGAVDIARLQLGDAHSDALLANADFDAEMARWFFSSDRHHMPWHAKSVPVHLLVEHGLLGLGLLSLVVLAAAWRLSLGRGRDHALAPVLAGALGGFLVVGLFDSLLDVPRLALLFYLLLLLSLGLRTGPPSSRSG